MEHPGSELLENRTVFNPNQKIIQIKLKGGRVRIGATRGGCGSKDIHWVMWWVNQRKWAAALAIVGEWQKLLVRFTGRGWIAVLLGK